MKGQFLCTFTSNDSLSLTIDYLSTYYKIYNNKFYMYTDRDNPNSILLIYNTEDNLRDGLAKNTISINKKKQTNTLYTINALNSLIKLLNNGILDKSYQIDWENYKDILLIVKRFPIEEHSGSESYFEERLVFVKLDFRKSIYL